MTRGLVCLAVLAACARPPVPALSTTSGAIALANLDQLIAQPGDDLDRVDLLLSRARYLGDTDALDRAVRTTEAAPALTADALLRRARTRAATHRFRDALDDLSAAERAGARTATERAMIQIALGRPDDALPVLQADLLRRPSYASYSALAVGYAATGAFAAADALYAAARSTLIAGHATSPLPYAWIWFARGLMWTEQAGDPARGEWCYRQAIRHVPAFYTAQVHLAELEATDGNVAAAIDRLTPLTTAGDPEALGLLGRLHLRAGDPRGWLELARARTRYALLLARAPLAYADHAAELLLAIGDAPDAAPLAQLNLANRQTPRAAALVIRAALGAPDPRSGR